MRIAISGQLSAFSQDYALAASNLNVGWAPPAMLHYQEGQGRRLFMAKLHCVPPVRPWV